jgi:DNA repair protein RadC
MNSDDISIHQDNRQSKLRAFQSRHSLKLSAKPFGIAVHDHIIIGKKGHASMKGLLLI